MPLEMHHLLQRNHRVGLSVPLPLPQTGVKVIYIDLDHLHLYPGPTVDSSEPSTAS